VRTETTKQFLRLMQRIRVPMGSVVVPAMFILAGPSYVSLLAGAPVAVAGLCIRAWASGYLKKNETLATAGPYSYTRNPLYLGTLILGLGASVCTGSIWLVGLFVILYCAVYLPVMMAEADTMRAIFPEQYEQYSRHVALLIPRSLFPFRGPNKTISPDRVERRTGFDLALYVRNREYRAALGLAVIVALLALKAAFLIGPGSVWRLLHK
jgi:protein-S-isoprenylcysteine O-methyltransferase Ste14